MSNNRNGPMGGLVTQQDTFQVSAIIPTKNRPEALEAVVRTLLAQTVMPFSLVIVDQSADGESHPRIDAQMNAARARGVVLPHLEYIYDTTITSAAAARNRGMTVAGGNIWLFLDDDVTLDPDFIEQLIAVYRKHPEASGVSAVITNYPRPPLGLRIWMALFVRGPFHDERQPIYWDAERLRNALPTRVDRFGGGLASFRTEAIRGKHFDETLGPVWYIDDVDFCFRLGAEKVLLIAPRVRLEHHHDPVGRLQDHWLRRHAHSNLFLYRRHWKGSLSGKLSYAWLWVGYSAIATMASLRRRSLGPWRALRMGAREAASVLTLH
jgi:GT2 family glycosyltransferase